MYLLLKLYILLENDQSIQYSNYCQLSREAGPEGAHLKRGEMAKPLVPCTHKKNGCLDVNAIKVEEPFCSSTRTWRYSRL